MTANLLAHSSLFRAGIARYYWLLLAESVAAATCGGCLAAWCGESGSYRCLRDRKTARQEEEFINHEAREGKRCPRNRFEQRQCRVARGSESRFGDLWGPVGWNPKQIAPKRGSVWHIRAVRNAKKEILDEFFQEAKAA